MTKEEKITPKFTFNEGDCFVVNKTSKLEDRIFLRITRIIYKNTVAIYQCTRITNREMDMTDYDLKKLEWLTTYWHYERCTLTEIEEGINNLLGNAIGKMRFHFSK